MLNEYHSRLVCALELGKVKPVFFESLVAQSRDNTWHDTAKLVVGNWMGLVYQVTYSDLRIPFMEGVDPDDPLDI